MAFELVCLEEGLLEIGGRQVAASVMAGPALQATILGGHLLELIEVLIVLKASPSSPEQRASLVGLLGPSRTAQQEARVLFLARLRDVADFLAVGVEDEPAPLVTLRMRRLPLLTVEASAVILLLRLDSIVGKFLYIFAMRVHASYRCERNKFNAYHIFIFAMSTHIVLSLKAIRDWIILFPV